MAQKTDQKPAAEIKPTQLTPRATEKTYALQTTRTYAFFVKPSETKQSIAKHIAEDFNVVVETVRVLTRKGKKTKFSKGRHAYPGTTFRRDHKLAYVTLKEGHSIRVFDTEKTETDDKKSPILSADKTSDNKKDSKAKKTTKTADAKEAKVTKKSAKADTNASKENN